MRSGILIVLLKIVVIGTLEAVSIPEATRDSVLKFPTPENLPTFPSGCYDGSVKAKECCKLTAPGSGEGSKEHLTFDLNYDIGLYSSGEGSHESGNNWWDSEYFADPKDCHKYFKCDKGKEHSQKCPGKHQFSPALRECVYTGSSKCQDLSVSSTTSENPTTKVPSTTEPAPTTTNNPTTTEAPSTTESAPTTPENLPSFPLGCYDGSMKAKECCKLTAQGSGEGSKERLTFDLNYGIGLYSSGEGSHESGNNWWDSEYFADPKDCHKYFKCDKGKEHSQKCPDKHQFSPELRECVYTGSSKCQDLSVSSTTSENPTTKVPSTTEPAPTTTNNPTTTEAPSTTESAPTTPENLPSFPLGCYDGSMKAKECCKLTAQGSGEGSKERLTFDLNYGIGLYSSGEGSHESGNNWWDSEYFADPKDCHKYFKCDKGKEHSQKCPDKHQFSPELRECVYTGSSKCQDLSVSSTTSENPTTKVPSTTEPAPTTTNNPTTTEAPSTTESAPTTPENLPSFPLGCYDGSMKAKECCKLTAQGSGEGSKERLTFDLNYGIGLYSSGEGSHESGNNWWDSEYFADPKDCHKYFKCDKGKEHSQKCPDKHQFSPELRECVYTGSSKCQDLSVSSTTSENPTTKVPSTTEPAPTTTNNPTTTEAPSTTESAPTTPENLPSFPLGCYDGSMKAKECCKLTAQGSGEGSKERLTFDLNYGIGLYSSGEGSHESGNNWWDSEYFADPKDCHKYFKCDKGKEHSQKCPDKHQFSPELRECVYTGSSKCQDLSVSSTTSENPTTKVPSTTEPAPTTTNNPTTTEAPSTTESAPTTPENLPSFPLGCYDGSMKAKECCKLTAQGSGEGSKERLTFDLNYGIGLYSSGEGSHESGNNWWDSEYFADPKDCHKYFKCDKGKEHSQKCPDKHQFSPELRECVYTGSSKCQDLSVSSTTSENPTTKVPSTTEPAPTTTNNPTTTEAPSTTESAPTTPENLPSFPLGCYDGSMKAKECCKLTAQGSGEGSKERLTFDLNYGIGLYSSGEGSHESGNNWWDSEYFADPKDCHKYFKCDKGKEHSQKCPDKHQFSPELRECVYTGSSKCQDLSVSSTTSENPTTKVPSTTEPAPTTTNNPTTTEAPSTTESAPTTPENLPSFPLGCYDGSMKAKECCKLTAQGSGEGSKERLTFDLNYGIGLYSSGEGSHESGNNWWDSEYFADPKDCHKYFKCDKGKEHSQKCPDKHQFSPELRECVYTGSNKCQELSTSTTEDVTTTDHTTTESTTIETTTIVSTTTESADIPDGCYDTSIHVTECCGMAPNNSTFPDRKNCFMYYICENGIPVRKRCPYKTRWNLEQKKCVYTSQVQCDWILPPTLKPPPPTIETTPRPTTTEKLTTPTTTESTTTQTTTVRPTTEDPHLPDGCYDTSIHVTECCGLAPDNTTFPDRKNCFMYYICENGIPVRKRCPYKTRWNLEQKKCVYTSQVQCDWILPPTLRPPPTIETSSPPTTTEKLTTPTTTTQTTTTSKPSKLPAKCYDGSISARECCKMTIKSKREISDVEDMESESNELVFHGQQGSSWWNLEFLADPSDCHKYYKCVAGKPVHMSCPRYTQWSIEKKRCEYTGSKRCKDNVKPTTTTASPSTERPTTISTTTNERPTTANPSKLPAECYDGSISAKECCKMTIKGKSVVLDYEDMEDEYENYSNDLLFHGHHGSSWWNLEFLSDPRNCHKYYKCVAGKPVHMSCPRYTQWSIEKKRCEYTGSKRCKDNVKPTTTTASPSTERPTTISTTTNERPTTANPSKLPTECYDGSISAKECCKMTIKGKSVVLDYEDMEDEYENYSNDLLFHGHHGSSWWNLEFLSDPRNCHKYYKCVAGKPVHMSCPRYTQWSIEKKRCEYTGSKRCKDNVKPTTTTASPSTERPTTISTTTNERPTTANPSKLPVECYDGSISAKECCKMTIKGKSVVLDYEDMEDEYENYSNDLLFHGHHGSTWWNLEFLADPRDCHKYYKCVAGKPVHISCPRYTQWSIEKKRCVYTGSRRCKDIENPITTTQSSSATEFTISTEATAPTEEITSPSTTLSTAITEVPTIPTDPTTPTEEVTTPSSTSSTTTPEIPPIPTLPPTTTEEVTTSSAASSSASTEIPSISTDPPTTTEEVTTPSSTSSTTTPEIPTSPTLPPTTTEEVTTPSSTSSTTTPEIPTSPTLPPTTTEEVTTPSSASSSASTEMPSIPTDPPTPTEEVTTPSSTSSTTTPEIPTSPTLPPTTTEEVTTPSSTSSTTTPEIPTSPTFPPTTTEEVTTPSSTSSTTTPEIPTSPTLPSTTTEEVTTPSSASSSASTEIPSIPTDPPTPTEEVTTPSSTSSTTTPEIPTSPTLPPTTTEEVTTPSSTSSTTTPEIPSSPTLPPTTTEEVTTPSSTSSTTTPEIPTIPTNPPTVTEEVTTSSTTTTEIPTIPTNQPTPSLTTSNTISTEDESETTTPSPSTTTEFEPTADPNGSCGTAPYKCRHGLISAEECCKGVPYWEDRLLQNNDNCGTYFQCVHEKPEIRICSPGLFWNADVCRCEWKEISTCNF